MRLYNSYTLKTEEFKSIKPGEVSMYVCGPTVYNHAHIGNARPIVVFDTLRRTLEAEGYKVKFVSNFTDVDDKILKKADEQGVSPDDIAKKYYDIFSESMKKLNNLKPGLIILLIILPPKSKLYSSSIASRASSSEE